MRLASGTHRASECPGHAQRIARRGNGRIHQTGIRAHFHGLARLGRLAYARVDHHGQRTVLDEDAQHFPGLQPPIRADGRPQRHDRGGSGINQTPRHIQIRIHVREDHEAFLCENLGGLGRLVSVGQQVAVVRNDLDLDPVATSHGPGKPGDAHGLVRGTRSRGVGQQLHVLRDEIHDIPGIGFEIHPPEGHGDDLCARGLAHIRDDRVVSILSGSDEQTAVQCDAADFQLIFLHAVQLRLPATDNAENFKTIALYQPGFTKGGAGNDFLIALHHKGVRGHAPGIQKLQQAHAGRDVGFLSVDYDDHGTTPFRTDAEGFGWGCTEGRGGMK